MFGYIASIKLNESKLWNYASVSIFQEIGGDIKLHRGKVFRSALLEEVRRLKVGQSVCFKTRDDSRRGMKYMQYTEIQPASFTSCGKCGKAVNGDCLACSTRDSERLLGEFTVLESSRGDYEGTRLIARREDLQVAFVVWDNGPFAPITVNEGDVVFLCGWRTIDRRTHLRRLQVVRTSKRAGKT